MRPIHRIGSLVSRIWVAIGGVFASWVSGIPAFSARSRERVTSLCVPKEK
jgi:hypothetical protein